jgi:hypothetical protein
VSIDQQTGDIGKSIPILHDTLGWPKINRVDFSQSCFAPRKTRSFFSVSHLLFHTPFIADDESIHNESVSNRACWQIYYCLEEKEKFEALLESCSKSAYYSEKDFQILSINGKPIAG